MEQAAVDFGAEMQIEGLRKSSGVPRCERSGEDQELLVPFHLSIMLLSSNILGRLVLRGADTMPFIVSHDSIRLGLVFHFIDVFLLRIEPSRLTLV